MASISLQNVTKIFDRRTTAVRDLTLDVPEGELMVLVGPSGCGKTTILRLIAGVESPTSGEIRIGNRAVNGVGPRERDVAMVFQDGVLYPHLSVYANLAFPLRLRGWSRTETRRRVEAVLGMLDLADLVNRKPAALSGGQRQRVALGRALVREPAVFLLDEPLSSLDGALRAALREEIKALHQKLHTTMLYVTHDQSEAMALGERVCVLQEGQIQQVGPPAEIYDRPANRFVAAFFGAPPMNFLAGSLRWENGSACVELAAEMRSDRQAFVGCEARHVSRASPPARVEGILPSIRRRDAFDTRGRDARDTASRTADPRSPIPTVVVGVRPHDLSLEPLCQKGGSALAGCVSLLEPFGARTDVHVTLAGGEKCIVSAPPHIRLKIGDEVRVYIDPDKLHLFQPDGTALDRTPGKPCGEHGGEVG